MIATHKVNSQAGVSPTPLRDLLKHLQTTPPASMQQVAKNNQSISPGHT